MGGGLNYLTQLLLIPKFEKTNQFRRFCLRERILANAKENFRSISSTSATLLNRQYKLMLKNLCIYLPLRAHTAAVRVPLVSTRLVTWDWSEHTDRTAMRERYQAWTYPSALQGFRALWDGSFPRESVDPVIRLSGLWIFTLNDLRVLSGTPVNPYRKPLR